MKNLAWMLCAALAACGGDSGGGTCGGGGGLGGGGVGGGGGGTTTGGAGGGTCADAPTGSSVHYQTFVPKTRSVGDAIGSYQIALTDGSGGTACGLSTDQRNSLGVAGHEIIASVTGDDTGSACIPGTYSIGADCPAVPSAEPSLQTGCAYYRPFDSTGKSMGYLAATAGSVTVSGDYTACTFTVNLSFSGMQFDDSFTLHNAAQLPWCTP